MFITFGLDPMCHWKWRVHLASDLLSYVSRAGAGCICLFFRNGINGTVGTASSTRLPCCLLQLESCLAAGVPTLASRFVFLAQPIKPCTVVSVLYFLLLGTGYWLLDQQCCVHAASGVCCLS